MPLRKFFLILSVSTVVLLFTAFYVRTFTQQLPDSQLPVLGQVNDFNLRDSQGKSFSLENLKGKIWVADFIFTTCAGICPVMTKNMGYLQSAIMVFDNVDLVSISVNPEQDNVDELARYAKEKKANINRWHFLTGSREDIQKLAVGSFKVGSVSEPIFHSDRFILVDQEGKIRGYYEGTKVEGINRILQDINHLRKGVR